MAGANRHSSGSTNSLTSGFVFEEWVSSGLHTSHLGAGSGRIVGHRLNRGANRQLNRAIHTAAITPIARNHSERRRLYEQHLNRGKTKREAVRALKRRISDRIWTHLQHHPTDPQLAPSLT